MNSTLRTSIAVLAFAVAAIGALLLMRMSEPAAKDDQPRDSVAATSDIWKVGDTWVVNVSQDSGTITPDAVRSIATVPYSFRVAEAPAAGDKDGAWKVTVTQEGAEGPFAEGWTLQYQERDGAMQLWRVAQGKLKPMEAELATIVLGMGFPYETKLTKLPAPEATVSSAKLQARSALPPATSVPTSKNSGAAPPTDAPNVPAGALPPGAPGS
ncbi:MAG: hypothetical protein JWM25_1414 [Thermoleophilia bacterium]|nr:hypothetical protein [Thermoleophilia bacterium]MCZ4496831.1 hypothetical protein [Thermoleophilia bacterium]